MTLFTRSPSGSSVPSADSVTVLPAAASTIITALLLSPFSDGMGLWLAAAKVVATHQSMRAAKSS